MREFFQGVVDQVGDQWQRLGRSIQVLAMLGGAAAIVALIIVAFFWRGSAVW